ncbi:hypothetical protein [Streptomyces sp. KLOTTS4A1]|uniref:hypothetical protein n=1 Tax=Streptomyces sp. KLOTTS4A1 TaxID=3390996 RepID=UPI0039F48884
MAGIPTQRNDVARTWGILGAILGVPLLLFLLVLYLAPDRNIGCGPPCDGSMAKEGTTVTYDDGLQVTVSRARWLKKDFTVRMVITFRNTGDRPVTPDHLSIVASDQEKSLPMDWHSPRTLEAIPPDTAIEVEYTLRVDDASGHGPLRIGTAPGDAYERARWSVRIPGE